MTADHATSTDATIAVMTVGTTVMAGSVETVTIADHATSTDATIAVMTVGTTVTVASVETVTIADHATSTDATIAVMTADHVQNVAKAHARMPQRSPSTLLTTCWTAKPVHACVR
jgi:hypothetical protein